MTFYVLLKVCNGYCAKLHEFTFTHCSPFTYFLSRNTMRKRGLCCRPVSVRPSVCHARSCIVSRRLKISTNFFHGRYRHNYNFWPLAPVANSKGNPFSGASNTPEVEKFAIFDWSRRLSWKWYEIGPLLLLKWGLVFRDHRISHAPTPRGPGPSAPQF